MRMTISGQSWRLGIAGALAISLFAFPGCKDENASKNTGNGTGTNNTQASSNDIVIGEYGSMTGSEAAFGKSTDDAIQLATEQINAAGGIDGKKVRIELEDDASDAGKAETAVRRLIDEKHVIAVLGEVASSNSLAGGKVCQDKNIPMISPSSTKPSVTQLGDYIFRVCFIDSFQAPVVARFAIDGLHAKRVAIFTNESQSYSKGFRDDFKKAFVQFGGQIVAEGSYTKDDKDYRSALTAIQASKPDAILVPGYYGDAGAVAKQARDLGITVPLLGGDGWDNQKLFDSGGDAVNGCYFSDHMSIDDPSPSTKAFVTAFQNKFKETPDALAALGYDAANLMFDAIKRAKSTDPKAIRDAIAATKDFPGVTGKITIDADRNANKPAVIIAIKDRHFKFQALIADPNKPMAQK
jgi:branched-chain amino acid transport system substrate-binding protein